MYKNMMLDRFPDVKYPNCLLLTKNNRNLPSTELNLSNFPSPLRIAWGRGIKGEED
ncbi:hypothetical protein LEWO105114_07280 [Legionella worsleiensis]|uniref:Uncharacterized protein n=1 Tax=Legionella worsleiensis TaxID=45076 RepID=A0A0W1AJ53_9GAMM|nr:hypothetical protein Lwor_0684 [Legionella worsleiensis]STY30074.1 Uncharacterised protein [Legionella worsleiensis]